MIDKLELLLATPKSKQKKKKNYNIQTHYYNICVSVGFISISVHCAATSIPPGILKAHVLEMEEQTYEAMMKNLNKQATLIKLFKPRLIKHQI